LVDWKHLRQLAEQLGGDALRPLLCELASSVASSPGQLAALCRSGNRAELRVQAHRLRGQAAMMGCCGLAAALASLEELAIAPEATPAAIGAQIEAIASLADATALALQGFADQRPSNQPAANAATMATHQIQLEDAAASG